MNQSIEEKIKKGSWQAEVLLTYAFHIEKQEKYGRAYAGCKGGWGIRDTAKVLHKSVGVVHKEISIAVFLNQGVITDLLLKMNTMTLALRYMSADFVERRQIEESLVTYSVEELLTYMSFCTQVGKRQKEIIENLIKKYHRE